MTHIRGDVLVLIVNAQRDGDELLKGLLHPLPITDGEVAQDEVEARPDVGALAHDVFERRYGVRVLAHADEDHADVLHDLDPHFLVGVGDLIQSHAVELDGFGVVLLFEVDVGHVDLQSACRGNQGSSYHNTTYQPFVSLLFDLIDSPALLNILFFTMTW